MKLKNPIHTPPVHERRLEFSSYAVENDQVIVEGWLKDDRFVQRYQVDGSLSPPGKVHRICVRLLLGGWPLSILDAEAEMPFVPHDECPATQDTVKGIIGLTITHGYGDRVLERLGGVKGCAHMVQLIIAMGNAALHGYWTQKLQHPLELPETPDELPELDYVIGSCMLWRKDGPMIQKIRAAFKSSRESNEDK